MQYSHLFGGVSLSLRKPIEKRFKNRTLTFISLAYISACIITSCTSIMFKGNGIVIPIILLMYAISIISTSIWYILETKYLKNFAKEEERNKITFAYEFVGATFASIFSILGGLLLEIIDIGNAYLIVSLFGLLCMIIVLDYMRKRFGLKPEEYLKEDIEF